MKWKNLQMPRGAQKEESSYSATYGKFIIEPLEQGFGVTLGTALRRVLLASVQGASVVSVRIDGVLHEFSTIPGVVEDVPEILMNIKQLKIKLNADEDARIRLDIQGEGEVTAANIESNPDVEILNKNLHIASLNGDAHLSMELNVHEGRGYRPAETNKKADDPIGVIPIDSHFSPVEKVNIKVDQARVGDRTDYDKLILEIWTDGTMTPDDSLAYAAKMLQNHLNIFINFEGDLATAEEVKVDENKNRVRNLLNMRVDELELSVRSSNCLRLANIHTLRDLVKNQESDMLKYKNFGKKSLVELNQILHNLSLHFGMEVGQYEDEKR
jgi:DNA-directed RNA polymerase subunit alpha